MANCRHGTQAIWKVQIAPGWALHARPAGIGRQNRQNRDGRSGATIFAAAISLAAAGF
jgi:hypothetical protein